MYLSRDMPREAAALYARLTASGGHPTAGDSHRLGLAYCREREWDSARAAFSAMAELAPADGSAELYLGHLAREQGDTNRAEAHYRAALRKEPSHTEAMVALPTLKMRSGDWREAAGHFRQAILLGERGTGVLHDHVVSLMHCDEPAETRSAMELALARHPTDPDILRLFERHIALAAGRAGTSPLE